MVIRCSVRVWNENMGSFISCCLEVLNVFWRLWMTREFSDVTKEIYLLLGKKYIMWFNVMYSKGGCMIPSQNIQRIRQQLDRITERSPISRLADYTQLIKYIIYCDSVNLRIRKHEQSIMDEFPFPSTLLRRSLFQHGHQDRIYPVLKKKTYRLEFYVNAYFITGYIPRKLNISIQEALHMSVSSAYELRTGNAGEYIMWYTHL